MHNSEIYDSCPMSIELAFVHLQFGASDTKKLVKLELFISVAFYVVVVNSCSVLLLFRFLLVAGKPF